MPELPDLVYIVDRLRPALLGRRIVEASIGNPTVLRILVPGDFGDLLAGAGRPTEEKVRDPMRVRNRAGLPCPVCGTTIRKAGVLGFDTFFCPGCQKPKTEQFINWSRRTVDSEQ